MKYTPLVCCLSIILITTLFLPKICNAASVQKGNVVKVTGTKGKWELTVNGEVFRIKGVGVGRATGQGGADHLKMAKDMGANTVRTWGVNQGTRKYLDTAHKYGLMVDAGIWLNAIPEGSTSKESYLDPKFLAKTRKEILAYIRKYKDHPAILMWNIGNEVIFFTKSEEERVAFSKFLESVIQDVRAIDPNHPILYTAAGLNDVAYLEKYVPSLDIIGINTYGGIEKIHQELTAKFNIPYLMTEFGSLGDWDRNKDPRGVSFELSDDSKMSYYRQLARQIKSYYGSCLGGFVFLLGDTTQVSLTWWNINEGSFKKYPFWVMEDFYKEREFRKVPFVVKDMRLSKSNLKPREEFEVSVELKNVQDPKAPVEYTYAASGTLEGAIQLEYPNKRIALKVEGQGPSVKIQAPSKPGIYRVYVIASTGDYASTYNKSIKVAAAQADGK